MLADLRARAVLFRWLGPWAPPEASPAGVAPSPVEIPGPRKPIEAWLYSPRAPAIGRYVVAPGLHFDGPADPRMRRFCAILAHAGVEVLAPFLPDFCALRVTPEVVDDFEAAFAWLAERRAGRLGLFSISFGSLPALRLAANPRWAGRLSHAVCFGGYADFSGAMEFALSGARRDPLNQAAVFINLIDELDVEVDDRDVLIDGWMRYMRQTWGRPEMKARDRWEPVARAVAAELPESLRPLFLVGCGAEPGALELARDAFARRGDLAFVDPRPHLPDVSCPVYLVHGRDDDVIPHGHAAMLAGAFDKGGAGGAPVEVLLTGLYDHTRPSGGGDLAAKARLMAAEGATMLRILEAMLGFRRAA